MLQPYRHPRLRRSPAALTLVALVAGCGAQPAPFDAGPADGSSLSAAFNADPVCGPGVDAVTADPPVIDPWLEGARVTVRVRVRPLAAFPTAAAVNSVQPVHVGLYRDDTEVRVLAERSETLPGSMVEAVWDGTLDGAPAARGAYSVRVRYGCDLRALAVPTRVHVVRLGVTTVTVGDGDGARIPMLWHKLGGTPNNYWLPPNDRPVLVRAQGSGAAALTLPDGGVSPFPSLSIDLTTPPPGALGDAAETNYNLPFALRVGTRPDVTLGFGRDDGGASPPRIRARLTGAHADDDLVSDGGAVTYRLDDSPAPMMARYDTSLRVRFEAERADHTWSDFGGESVALRAYGLLGDQTISAEHAEPYAPWLAVVDAVTGWVDGSTNDPHAVAGIIVHHVNEGLGLRYDTRAGASFYTLYRPNGYSGARFDLTGFLDRSRGSTVNCSDCASIVATYANMVGCDLGYSILTNNFRLNYIRAIGTTTFTNDPFRRGGAGGFSYHAVTTPSAEGTDIFDATLVVDGDELPGAAPFVDLTPDGLPRSFYLAHLSPVRLTVTHDDKTAIE